MLRFPKWLRCLPLLCADGRSRRGELYRNGRAGSGHIARRLGRGVDHRVWHDERHRGFLDELTHDALERNEPTGEVLEQGQTATHAVLLAHRVVPSALEQLCQPRDVLGNGTLALLAPPPR